MNDDLMQGGFDVNTDVEQLPQEVENFIAATKDLEVERFDQKGLNFTELCAQMVLLRILSPLDDWSLAKLVGDHILNIFKGDRALLKGRVETISKRKRENQLAVDLSNQRKSVVNMPSAQEVRGTLFILRAFSYACQVSRKADRARKEKHIDPQNIQKDLEL